MSERLSNYEWFLFQGLGIPRPKSWEIAEKMLDTYLHPTRGWKGSKIGIIYRRKYIAHQGKGF